MNHSLRVYENWYEQAEVMDASRIENRSEPRAAALVSVDFAIASALAAASLLLYLRTMAPSVLIEDAAEFQTLASTLGLTHPSGYPVYILIAKLFTLLPFGEVAYRVNLLSGVFAAFTVGILYIVCRLFGSGRVPAVLASCVLAASGVYWYFAVTAEVYTLAAAFTALFLLLVLLWRQREQPLYPLAIGALFGLSLGVHFSLALLSPAFVVYLCLARKSLATWLRAAAGLAAGIALTVLAFYLLDRLDPPSSYFNTVVRPSIGLWGYDQPDLGGFGRRLLFLITARQIRGLMFRSPLRTMAALGRQYFHYLAAAARPASIVFMAIGCSAMVVRWRNENVLILLGLTLLWLVTFNYPIGEFTVFYIPSHLLLAVGLARGLTVSVAGALRLAERLGLRAGWRPFAAVGVNAAALIAFLAMLATWAGGSIAAGRIEFVPEHLRERAYPLDRPLEPRDLARGLVGGLEDHAVVFTRWQNLYTLCYVAYVEQHREGMRFHEILAQEGLDTVPQSLLDYLEECLASRPVYITDPPRQIIQAYRLEAVHLDPALYRLSRRGGAEPGSGP